MNGLRNRIIYTAFSLLVTAAILGWLFSRISMGEVLDIIRHADGRGLWMFVALSLSMSFLRTWRYQLLLTTSGHPAPPFPLFLVVLVRNFFSDLLPARIGTLVYVYMVTSRLGLPFASAASSFALAFLFDLIALVPLIALATLFMGTGTGGAGAPLGWATAILCLILVLVLIMLPAMIRWAAKWTRALKLMAAERRARWSRALDGAAEDVDGAKRAGIYGRVLVLSLLVRCTKYGALYFFLFALLHPRGYALADLSVAKVFVGLCSSELAASLPISGIAGFGAYEGAWAVTFRVLGFPESISDLTAVAHHLFTQVYGYGLGAVALVVLLLPLFRRRATAPRRGTPAHTGWSFYAALAAFMIGLVLVLGLIYYLPFAGGGVSGDG